jgi:hypothetical protein
MTVTITWSGTITALSSVAHGGETRGTTTLLRRELVVQQDGRAVLVPLISGNAFRGRLRRIGEELLRDELGYEGQLPLAAAHAVRGGGSLAKVAAEPLSGARLHQLRTLVPHIGVFGCAASGRIADGCLQVGKVMPQVAECAHLMPVPAAAPTAFQATQIETYVRQDDSAMHSFAQVLTVDCVPGDGVTLADLMPVPDTTTGTAQLMMYRIETFPAGTIFGTWLRLTRATPLEASFFGEVLARFTQDGRLGGRAGIGHGRISASLAPTIGGGAAEQADWRAALAPRREEALAALQDLA